MQVIEYELLAFHTFAVDAACDGNGSNSIFFTGFQSSKVLCEMEDGLANLELVGIRILSIGFQGSNELAARFIVLGRICLFIFFIFLTSL